MTRIRPILSLSFFALLLSAVTTQAQVAPSATRNSLTLTAGVTVSAFKPSYIPNKLGGVGAYVDLNIFHGIGLEAEGRWQRFNQFEGISQDNYLLGPRYQFHRIWRLRPYAKGLAGFSNMNFQNNVGTGRFTTLAFGGGADLRVTRRISLRGDAEYQIWPDFLGGSIKPYGVSLGIGYRIF